MNVFQKRIFAAGNSLLIVTTLATVSADPAEAKSRFRHKKTAIAKTQRPSSSVYSRKRVAAGDVNGDGRANIITSRRSFLILPYIEQDNLYKR